MQTLTGDATDGYKGCPGVGPVKAKRILDKAIEEDIDMWDAVVDTFIKAKLSRDEAILQARMAYILRKDQYDGLDIYPKLWYPYDEIVETA
jgi:DNA polymerase-1